MTDKAERKRARVQTVHDGSGHDIDISTGTVQRMNQLLKTQQRPEYSELTNMKEQEQLQQRCCCLCRIEDYVDVMMHLLFLAYTLVIFFGEMFLLPENEVDWCHSAQLGYPNIKRYDNPDYNNNPCYKERPWQLLFMSQMETSFARRMFTAVIMGAAIGFERKASDRPAGIRTMSLVCLGACLFNMVGQLAFRSSTMGFDAARVSAAVPSGVGFLGAGLIWKGTVGEKGTSDERHEVHGLTTAASVWLSAAVGVGVGGKLYVVSSYCVALVILVLRLGPSLYFQDDALSYCDEDDYSDDFSDSSENFQNDDYSRKYVSRIRATTVDVYDKNVDKLDDRSMTIDDIDTKKSLIRQRRFAKGMKKSWSCPNFGVHSTNISEMPGAGLRRKSELDILELSSLQGSINGSLRYPGRLTPHVLQQAKRQVTNNGSERKLKRGSLRKLQSKRRFRGVSFHS